MYAHGLRRAGDGLQELRAGHVHEQHLHGQGRVLVELNVYAGDAAQDARARGGQDAEQRTQQQGECQACGDNAQGHAKALPKRSHVGERQRPALGIK